MNPDVKPALLFGNGINLYAKCGIKWRDLLFGLAPQMNPSKNGTFLEGIAETELYELIKMNNRDKDSVPTQVLDIIKKLPNPSREKSKTLQQLFSFIKQQGISVLTTNIDWNIEKWAGLKANTYIRPLSIPNGYTTPSYPWSMYFADIEDQDPFHSFSVWHINGMWCYKRSLKFGLAEYMHNVRKTNELLTRKHNAGINDKPNMNIYEMRADFEKWEGSKTWLRFFFDRPIIILGLTLGINEVFLRWLLIQRKKFFDESKRQGFADFSQAPPIHLLMTRYDNCDSGQELFLNSVGVAIHRVSSYDELYTHSWKSYL